jgi:tetratricopeptide (TPR) repeat protein
MELNKPERALEYFQQAISLSPDEVDYYIGAGHCLLSLKKPQAAILHFQRALNIKPGSPDSLAGLALTYTHLDRDEDALNVYNQLEHIDTQTAHKVNKKMIAIKKAEKNRK